MPKGTPSKPGFDVAEMVARYGAGESLAAIGAALGCSASLVSARLVAAGVEIRPPGPASPAIDDEEIAALYRSGLSTWRIAGRFGVSRRRIYGRVRQLDRLGRLGVPMRPRGGPAGRRGAADI